MTRWMEVGEEDSCVVRWVMNLANGDDTGLVSVKSRTARGEVGTNCIWVEEGRTRRLVRSKSWQNIDWAWEADGDCWMLLSN